MPFFYMDYWYLVLVLPAVALSLWAQIKVKSTFSKYSRLAVGCGLTGEEVSRRMQQSGGIRAEIRSLTGSLTDHFDPRSNTVFLSRDVYNRSSVAAVGVAAHETGHALQHAQAYAPVRWRTNLVPVTNFAASLSPILVVLGILMTMDVLAYVGIALFSMSVLFHLVTLPVEFNASARAMAALESSGQFTQAELQGVRRVLTAAALTYVAATLVSLMSLLRLVLLVGGRSRRN